MTSIVNLGFVEKREVYSVYNAFLSTLIIIVFGLLLHSHVLYSVIAGCNYIHNPLGDAVAYISYDLGLKISGIYKSDITVT